MNNVSRETSGVVSSCGRYHGCENRAHTSGTCYQRYLELQDEVPGPTVMSYDEWLEVTQWDETDE